MNKFAGAWLFVSLAMGVAIARAQEPVSSAPESLVSGMDEHAAPPPPIRADGAADAGRKRGLDIHAIGQLRKRVAEHGSLTDEQWREVLRLSGAIRVREHWPVALPLAISVQAPMWLPLTELRVKPRRVGLAAALGGSFHQTPCGNCGEARSVREGYQELGMLPLGKHRLVFDVHIEADADGNDSSRWSRAEKKHVVDDSRTLWIGTYEAEVEIVPTIAEALPAARGGAIDRAVRGALRISRSNEGVRIDPLSDFYVGELAGMAYSLEYELRRAGKLVQTLRVQEHRRGGYLLGIDVLKLPVAVRDTSKWTLHVRGLDEGVMRDLDAERHWRGELVIPLREIERSKRARHVGAADVAPGPPPPERSARARGGRASVAAQRLPRLGHGDAACSRTFDSPGRGAAL